MNNSLPVAYSHLPKVLAERRLKISDLQEKLKAAGINVNQKSLYRLTTSAPLLKIDTRIVGAICRMCAVGIEDVITFERPKLVLEKLSGVEQKQLDDLMIRNNEGELTAAEMRKFDELSEKAHHLTMSNARMLAAQRRGLNSTRHSLTIRTRKNTTGAGSAKRVLQPR